MTAEAPARPRVGLAANWRQFALLLVVNAFVGAMVGIERTVLPLLAEQDFAVTSASAALSFLVAFGLAKAGANLLAGHLSDRIGRKRVLVAGWIAALPVAPIIIWAPSWGWVVAANALLGVNQGLAWSMTVIMKIDLAGPRRRGLALGLNEAAGYGAVAVAAAVTGALAAAYGPRPAPFVLGIGIAVIGLVLSVGPVRDTWGHAHEEARQRADSVPARSFGTVVAETTFRDPSLSAASQAGLVNNLNDAMAWGVLPLFLADEGLSLGKIGIVAALYPASWGLGQLATGAWSDRVGRKRLIVAGLWIQAGAIAAFVVASSFGGWVVASLGMGIGTALVYPTLLATLSDHAHPSWRASAVGVYRLWRDLGYAVGGLLVGVVTDVVDIGAAILLVAALTAVSGIIVATRMVDTQRVGAATG